MEDLIAQIQEKTGLPADKVLEVVTIVTDYMKERLPDDLIEQVTAYLSEAAGVATGAAGSAGGMASGAATTATAAASGAVEKVVDTASSVFSKVVDTVSGVDSSNDDD